MNGNQELSSQQYAQPMIDQRGLDISRLSPKELVDLHRLLFEEYKGPDYLDQELDITLQNLPEADPPRAREIAQSFAESPLPADRAWAVQAIILPSMLQADHDTAMSIYDRLVRDSDEHVRFTAAFYPEDFIEAEGSGMYWVDSVDEARLQEVTGLTRQDAYNLMLSYAYAENGQHVYDLGREALSKLMDPVTPESPQT